mmetsp:Transcript_56238/g.163041  ORF Transcript_56238/g.163041 Transcript_56238/m.163041 type:complete len:233 (-) Transcript_56238:57-755(-)|eukprot:CAMPEP_0176019482 /NCGR_PEP_ID=MMETSP0120_2-20121206/9413_1 /TAXON_ID=160619 /ORGANISM="Kryptoperidinium foliaceum, Strain CCMP 1326" /LENGTH=232 /DNA_ID=CAMNT_0017352559 /DNA_START=201 /DNA_END=899 /DNA_ORIENTATION=-
MTAIRRKRDDDSTFHSNSQCSGSLALDASQSSLVALDGSTVATDSSMPRRRRKRRRTTIVDQLQQIDISNGESGVPNQILEQAVLDDNSQISCSSAESGDEEEDHAQILPPSDVELAQRAVMRDLVFGRPPEPLPLNPVDRKIQSLVRQSLDNVHNGQNPFQFEANEILESQDDMHIDPVYTRPTDPGFFNEFRQGASQDLPSPLPPQRKRSNSLPGGFSMDESGSAPMEIN